MMRLAELIPHSWRSRIANLFHDVKVKALELRIADLYEERELLIADIDKDRQRLINIQNRIVEAERDLYDLTWRK
jgi:hypothetical protein